MNVLIVSQCQKNALKETRRILDQFAERSVLPNRQLRSDAGAGVEYLTRVLPPAVIDKPHICRHVL